MKTNTKTLLLTLVILLSVIILPSSVDAQEPVENLPESFGQSVQCGDAAIISNTASVNISQQYEAYVKLGKTDQSDTASLYAQSFLSSECQLIGTAQVTGQAWTRIGLVGTDSEELITFTLKTNAGEGLPSANRPVVMLVPANNPVCVPTDECHVEYDGKQGVLIGKNESGSEDSLLIRTVDTLENDSVEKVQYYVDGKAVYASKTIDDFDMRYVGGGEHVLTTVVSYESGQSLVITEEVTNNYTEAARNILFVFYQNNKPAVWLILGAIGVWAALRLLLAGIRKIHKRRLWKQTHIVESEQSDPQTKLDAQPQTDQKPTVQASSSKPHYIEEKSTLAWFLQRTAPIGLAVVGFVCVLVFINTFFLQIFSTHGASMQNTLYTGNLLLTNKTGKLVANISGREYMPKRGEIVVFQKKIHNSFDLGQEQAEETYVVKRVFGLPGDRVVIKNGKVTVFPEDKAQGLQIEQGTDWESNIQPGELNSDIDVVVGVDELFVIGDNRDYSVDSRTHGSIKIQDIIGNVPLRLTPGVGRL